ncbi:hypothetical protein HELRODRAFT_172063 [Helobdella robusta]|uniref:Uncharacterized protein n=1 Tax=Helobdella robusta TaxID=6412 RepID=T1F4Z7_HELRO|nr:hypothetical protein HELRODRAFT_172063 [Helobdella robusta]ESO05049.1 hypothetical protein HELRODRAFT_172063 [Helobdella robusta]
MPLYNIFVVVLINILALKIMNQVVILFRRDTNIKLDLDCEYKIKLSRWKGDSYGMPYADCTLRQKAEQKTSAVKYEIFGMLALSVFLMETVVSSSVKAGISLPCGFSIGTEYVQNDMHVRENCFS